MIENVEQLVEVMARAIDPGAWVEQPTASFRGMQAKGTPQDDITKAWWHRNGYQRRTARISARAGLIAAQAEGAEMVPSEATEGMQDAWLEQQNTVLERSGGYAVNCGEQYNAMLAANPLRLPTEE